MRITRDILLKIVRDTVAARTRSDRSLLAIYLHGSILEEQYQLGGSVDVDLFFVHTDQAATPREIVPLTDDAHLDIAHHHQRDYRQTRQLRVHPWLGPTLYNCKILYDPQHFLDFTQASVRGQFERPDYIMERSRKRLDTARQAWLSLHSSSAAPGPADVLAYLKAVEHAANAVISLYGPPLTERRFLQRLPARAQAAGKPGIYPGFIGLLGAQNLPVDTLTSWVTLWQSAFQSAQAYEPPARLQAPRLGYYLKAYDAFLAGDNPQALLWPLLHTWAMAAACLPADDEARIAWAESMDRLHLQGVGFQERLTGLDAYLDMVDETIERWGMDSGAYS